MALHTGIFCERFFYGAARRFRERDLIKAEKKL